MTIKLVDLYDGGGIRPGALEFLYELMKEREPEVNISHRAFPTFEQHRQFWHRRVYRLCYLIEFIAGTPAEAQAAGGYIAPVWAGYISATQNNEIGIVLRKQWRSMGLAPLAIRELIRLHRPLQGEPSVRNGHWLANIAPSNEHSKHVFQGLGFRKIQETYELPEEEDQHGSN